MHWNGRTILLRPIRADDAARHLQFLQKLHPEDIRLRLFQARRKLAAGELERLTQIDDEHEMAFVAVTLEGADDGIEDGAGRSAKHGAEHETVGVVRAVFDSDNAQADIGIIVRSDLKAKGLGRILLDKMTRYCRDRGTHRMVAHVMSDNHPMLRLARSAGWDSGPSEEPGILNMRLDLKC